MEHLVDPPNTEVRRSSKLWKILAGIFFVISVVMTALCLWMVLRPSIQTQLIPHSSTPSVDSTCPRQPPLFPLPSPLPQEINKTLHIINAHLINLVEKVEHKENMSAMSMNIVYQNMTLWSGHYGSKVFKGSIPPDDHTRYRIGSVTKIFPVLLLFKLYEDGIITSLDDPLVKYAPDFSITNPFSDININITLRQIASQMSGLPREAPCGYRCMTTTSAQQLALLKSEFLVVKPWTIPSYSNLGYALLGRLLTENLLNTTFETWVQEHILDPLGMRNTGFKITKEVKENMALPYFTNGTVMPFMELGWAGPAGEMYSTVADLMKLANVFIYPEEQSLLKPETVREMLLPDFITRDGLWLWGSPWEMRFTNDFVARQKGGNIDTYNAVFSVIPEMKLALSVLVSVAPVLKDEGFTCFKVADFIHATLLPALNQTLFEIHSKASFPISTKPFLGEYFIYQVSMATGKIGKINVTIKQDKDVLQVIPTIAALRENGFVLKYIGKPLLFQGVAKAAIGSPCIFAHLGLFCSVKFDPPGPDGLSMGFNAAAWKIKGVRIDSSNNTPPETNEKELPIPTNRLFFNPPI